MRLLFLAGLFLTACAHETTQIDRELALKIVDKLPTVTIHQTAPQPNVNVYNTAATQPLPPASQHCNNSPVYNSDGQLIRYQKMCFGGYNGGE